MSFRLINALATFIDLMNIVLKQYMDLFIIIFIDDTLVYIGRRRKKEEHASNLIIVLTLTKIAIYSLSLENVSFCCNPLVALVTRYLENGFEWIHRI